MFNDFNQYYEVIERESKKLSDRGFLFWQLWFCNYIYKMYREQIKNELIEKQEVLSNSQLELLGEINEYGWEVYDKECQFDKNKLDNFYHNITQINIEDLDLTETIDCALNELVLGLEYLLISLRKGVRGSEVLISQSTINILDTKLDNEGLDILDPEVFKRAEVQREVHGQYELLDILLDKKLSKQLDSKCRNIFKEELDKID